MKGRSPFGLPPSPAPKVMPGTVRNASAKVVTFVSSISCFEITDTDLGVSRRGATNLEFAD